MEFWAEIRAADSQAKFPEKYRDAYKHCMESPSSKLPKYIP